MDCSVLVRLRDMQVDCCAVIEFNEVEFRNLGIQLRYYTFMRVTKQLDGITPGPGTIFKEEASRECLLTFSLQCMCFQ